MTRLSPMKFGPPESPKHVPPLLALSDRIRSPSAGSPASGWLIEYSHGLATLRTRTAWSFHDAASGKASGMGPAENQTSTWVGFWAASSLGSTQCPAVRRTVDERRVPLHRQSGFPSAFWATMRPTQGWALP